MATRLPALALALVLTSSACSFLIDFDDLQGGVTAGAGGAGGAGGESGGRDGNGGGAATSGGTIDGQGGSELGASGQGGAPDLGIPIDAAPAALAAAVCTRLSACVGVPAMNILFSDEQCEKSTELSIANALIAAVARSEEEGRLDYDGTALPACLEAYEQLECEDVQVGFPEECKRALGALQERGEYCAHVLECGEGLTCEPTDCTCVPPATLGDPCLASFQCAAGLTCFMSSCQPLGAEGDACGGGIAPECITGLICVTADEKSMMPGRCFPTDRMFVLSEGQLCNPIGDPPTLCREGLSCPGVLQACVPTADRDGPCQLAFPDMCPENQYCSTGTCTDLPGPGEACAGGLVIRSTCSGYSRCVNGTC